MKLLTIVLEYLEPGWTEKTIECLERAGIRDYRVISREGVGSISKAFNEAVDNWLLTSHEAVWWVSNVTFGAEVPERMITALKGLESVGAVHPYFDSDHPHLRKPGENVPFLEWTAPMIRAKTLIEVGLLDEKMPYWGMDIDWSYRAKKYGWELDVVDAEINHTYLRHNKRNSFSQVRAQLRSLYHKSTGEALIEKWGPNWKAELCPTRSC